MKLALMFLMYKKEKSDGPGIPLIVFFKLLDVNGAPIRKV